MLLPRLGAWDFAFCVPFFLSHLFYRSAAQDACPDGDGGTENVASVVVVKQTIHIITSVPHDTTFKVNSELTVAVTNAPTQLDLITTYFYRSTIAQASTRSPNTKEISKGTFQLSIVMHESSRNQRRQADSFVGYNGRATSSCTQASYLSLVNGGLFINFADGTSAQYSANPGDAYNFLIPSTTPGNITTTFSLSPSGTLLWSNDAFFNGGANFCVLPSGSIVAVFRLGAQPTGCVFIALTVAILSQCIAPGSASGIAASAGGHTVVLMLPGGQGAPGATGLFGPSGAQGPSGLPGPQGSQGQTGPSGLQGPTGAQGVQGIPGVNGATGVTGLVGPQGIQGVPGPSGAQGPQGISGPQGIQGNVGPSGSQGSAGPSGPNGVQGLTGPTGATGSQGPQGNIGPQGIQGNVGPSGPQGLAGPSGPSGASGAQGPQGNIGPQGIQGKIGPSGLSGPQGLTGPSGAQGVPGPSGATGAAGMLAYSYLGCYYQSGTSSTSSGKVLANFQKTFNTGANAGCAALCSNQLFTFYGVVNGATGGAGVDCYCGDQLNYVTIIGLGNGMAPNNNCNLCSGGPSPAGECGLFSSSTVAIYARGY